MSAHLIAQRLSRACREYHKSVFAGKDAKNSGLLLVPKRGITKLVS